MYKLARQTRELTKIGTELFAPRGVPEPSDGLLLDLTDAFARELELFPDLFEREGMFPSQPEIEPDDFRLTFGQRSERPVDLLAQRFLDERVIGKGRPLVLNDVEEPVVLPLSERRVHREVAAGDLERVGHFEQRHIELFGKLAGARLPLELLFEGA